MTVRVHFDGKVFVPDEPVTLRSGTIAQVIIDGTDSTTGARRDAVGPLLTPVLVGLDPAVARAIGEDPEFDIENS